MSTSPSVRTLPTVPDLQQLKRQAKELLAEGSRRLTCSADGRGDTRTIAIARLRIEEEDAGRLPPGAVSPGRTVAEDLLDGDCGEPEIVRMILVRCHANVRGSFGRPILHDVMAMGFHDGASGWITEEEALAFAVALLDAGARSDVRDDLLKSTPLGWACRWGRLHIVKELLRRGVDATEPDAEPWVTPHAWAIKMGHHDIVALLG